MALVTGGGSGIGQACAIALAADGFAVVVADIDAAAAAVTAKALPGAIGIGLDVRSAEANDEAVAAAIERWGRIDALVTAAGIVRGGPAHEFSPQDFRDVLDVNVTGTYLSARAVGRAMIAAGTSGSIVLVGSILSAVALPDRAAYGASKGAVLQMGKVLALDWAGFGINVNVIGPGITATAMSDRQLADPALRSRLMATIPKGRMAGADEIASVVSFLCSPKASYMTGAFVPVDGGFLAGGGK